MTRDWDLRADALSAEAIEAGEPTAWFDRLYAEGVAGTVGIPWDRSAPNPQLAEWYAAQDRRPARAVVAGCGLGADAEFLAAKRWQVTGFDVAPTAMEQARARHPDSAVDYRVEDLLDLSPDLLGGFDLVVEVFTLQALPDPPRHQAAAGVASLVAPGGTLVAVAFREDRAPPPERPPFPLTRADLEALAVDGLEMTALDEPAPDRWRAILTRT